MLRGPTTTLVRLSNRRTTLLVLRRRIRADSLVRQGHLRRLGGGEPVARVRPPEPHRVRCRVGHAGTTPEAPRTVSIATPAWGDGPDKGSGLTLEKWAPTAGSWRSR
jgi:hypothetical protein